MKKVAFYTLGCKVNQYETEAMLEMFKKDGYTQVDSEEFADVYVINTCTVTHMSDRKSRQYIRRMKKKNPEAIIAVVGCYSQVSPEEILEIEEVNLVMGTNERRQIVEEIKKLDASKKASTVDDIMKVRAFEEIEINQTNGRTRAFMKIQDGCDRFCSYCIIPYARGGKVRSRDLESVVNEANKLVDNGYTEIVLTGIHVASYGKDVTDAEINLLSVIKAINEIEGVKRIRLSSVEPLLMTDEFIDTVSKMPKVCPHFHLSLQSGCDETLKRMNRRYTTKEYKEIVHKLREKMPNVAITTDVIVGFPGETNDEFNQTYKFLSDVELSQMHIFKYSPRKGTPAATMENQIDPQMKHLRSDKLIALNKKNFNKFATKFIGEEFEVLFEQNIGDNKYEGLTPNYIRVVVESNEDIQGKILNTKISDVKDEYVEGILV
ncbi:tRNA (N(6)-L-threonylcarbamoyladenosine(37)-C(2))-methylthiotransferase MtaB [Paeniclostridium hominis]|uniref:tRNA (N(6)-L-threonylcarbamoyladenosine(37)-C(2))- methylthiotransferase MtaB n=1 Tax=Paeniclostridium hominis TaxID=2764329 RepID=UPI0022E1877C|nr:tRNA (N(6)-L-threonylcarbamoyladenosine(37)-C(2))-methylthiotransferase MtaB [Paeniclostridium hominis]